MLLYSITPRLSSRSGESASVIGLVESADSHSMLAAGGVNEVAVPDVDPRMGNAAVAAGEVESVGSLQILGIDRRADHDLFVRGPRKADSKRGIAMLDEGGTVQSGRGGPAEIIWHAE